jgi:archaellum biogenesis protein FlaJ (TadC family)
MSTTNPILLVAAIFLILVGLTYPFFVLWRLNRQLSGSEAPANRQIAVSLALTALVPITAVLAGFWLVVPAARDSTAFTAALFGSGIALVVTLLLASRINR